jgi:hypothetical protein
MAEPSDIGVWTEMSEPQLRGFLADRGLSAADVEDSIRLAREWATRVTGATVFPTRT